MFLRAALLVLPGRCLVGGPSKFQFPFHIVPQSHTRICLFTLVDLLEDITRRTPFSWVALEAA